MVDRICDEKKDYTKEDCLKILSILIYLIIWFLGISLVISLLGPK